MEKYYSKLKNKTLTEKEAMLIAIEEYNKYLTMPISNAYFLVKESKLNDDSITVNKDKLPSQI